MYIRGPARLHAYIKACPYDRTHAHRHARMYMHINIYISLSVDIYKCKWIYTPVYIHIYVHTNTQKEKEKDKETNWERKRSKMRRRDTLTHPHTLFRYLLHVSYVHRTRACQGRCNGDLRGLLFCQVEGVVEAIFHVLANGERQKNG